MREGETCISKFLLGWYLAFLTEYYSVRGSVFLPKPLPSCRSLESVFFFNVQIISVPFCIQMIQMTLTSKKQNKLCVYNLVYVVLLQYIMVCHIDLA